MTGDVANTPAPMAKLKKFFYGLPQLPIMMAVVPMMMYMPQFYTGERGFDLGVYANIVLLVSIFDIVTDPLMGYISDRTNSRFGRRRPWVVLGVPVMMLGIYKLFMPGDGEIAASYLIIWMMTLRLGWTMIQIPYLAWGAEISTDYNERSEISGWRAGLGVLGAVSIQLILVCALFLFGFGGSGNAVWLTGVSVLLLLPLCAAIAIFFVPEPRRVVTTSMPVLLGLKLMWRNGPFKRVITAFLIGNTSFAINMQLFVFFMAAVIGDMTSFVWLLLYANICAFIAMPFWIKLSERIGKHRAWIGGFILIAISGPFNIFLGRGDLYWLIPIMTIGSIGSATFDALASSMKADIIDLDTLRTGEERAAWYFSVWMLATKSSMAIAGWLALMALDWSGFDPMLGIENGPDEILALKLLYGVVPSLLILPAVLVAWNYPITQVRHQRLRESLARRNLRRDESAKALAGPQA